MRSVVRWLLLLLLLLAATPTGDDDGGVVASRDPAELPVMPLPLVPSPADNALMVQPMAAARTSFGGESLVVTAGVRPLGAVVVVAAVVVVVLFVVDGLLAAAAAKADE